MKRQPAKKSAPPPGQPVSEVLILPDGKILAHNISPPMARVLARLDPADIAMKQRATQKRKS